MGETELRTPRTRPRSPTSWSPQEAARLYHMQAWSDGCFFANDAGHAAVRPLWNSDLAVDLYAVVEQLRERGVQFPALIRFQDLLQARVVRLNESFRRAIAACGYENDYRGVFPIKVNQLREVVEEILEAGAPYGYGLECGSKAELLATLPYLTSDELLLVCNGGKDLVMMRLMLETQELGKNVVPVLERYEEFDLLQQAVAEIGGEAGLSGDQFQFGVRVRLSTTGAGLWSESGGENSKFGISLTELLTLVDALGAQEAAPRFRLLHFHLGSQIADLQNVRDAAQEGGTVYARLRRRGLPLEYLDIGGGLGIDYEAGNPDVLARINYTLDEYTRAVVETVRTVCDREGVPHPTLVSESGRAVTAPHSVLIVEAVGMRTKDVVTAPRAAVAPHPILDELGYLLDHLRDGAAPDDPDALGALHAAADRLRARTTDRFRRGELTLEQKARAECLYWTICYALDEQLRRRPPADLPPGLAALAGQLVDQYVCNFSVFRSLADHWALGQRFPILPIHRLDEVPTRRGILVDLTCDSDGKVATFVSPTGDKRYLELHPLRAGEPYYLGCFLMGAYQDIMGDQHNLFGRVTEAHVYADAEEPGNFYIEKILPGTTVEEQLSQVQYFPNDLERRMNDLILEKVRNGRVRPREGVTLLEQYREALRAFTYLKT